MDALRHRLTTIPIYYGWVIACLCFVGLLAIYSINFSFGVFFDFIINDLDATRATASVAFSIQTLSLYLSSAIVGNVVDRFGVRRLVFIGASLLALGMLGASQATTLAVLVVTFGVIAGTGMGMIYVIAFTLPSRWFHQRRGAATAIASSGTGVATLVTPPAAAAGIAAIGWQETYLALTAFAVVGLLLMATFAQNDPWSMHIDASHEFPESSLPTSPQAAPTPQPADLRSFLHRPSFWLIVASWTVIYLPFFTLIVHFVAYTTDLGIGRWVGVTAISLIGGLSIPGRFLFGSLGDRIGRPAMFVALSLCIGTIMVILPFISTPVLLLVVASLFGIVHGGTGALVPPLISDFYGPEHVTALYGVAALAFAVSALAGPSLAGLTVEQFGSYEPFLIMIGLLVFAGSAGVHIALRIEGVDSRISFSISD